MTKTLKGLWFEAARNRWRVRLYRNRTLFHLSYHASYEDALNALRNARRKRPTAPSISDTPFAEKPPTTRNLIAGLRQSHHRGAYSC